MTRAIGWSEIETIGEGIETVLSASKKLLFKPVWSLIDKNGVAKFPVMSGIESVTISVDNDGPRSIQRMRTARHLFKDYRAVRNLRHHGVIAGLARLTPDPARKRT